MENFCTGTNMGPVALGQAPQATLSSLVLGQWQDWMERGQETWLKPGAVTKSESITH